QYCDNCPEHVSLPFKALAPKNLGWYWLSPDRSLVGRDSRQENPDGGIAGAFEEILLLALLLTFINQIAYSRPAFLAAFFTDLLIKFLAMSLPGGGAALAADLTVEVGAIFFAHFRAA